MNHIFIINSLADELADNPDYEAFFQIIKSMTLTEEYTEDVVIKLDQVYKIIFIRLLTQRKGVCELEEYCHHLSKITHRSRESAINSLSKPFFTLWVSYGSLIEEFLHSYDPVHLEKVMAMNHVQKIFNYISKEKEVRQMDLLHEFEGIGKKSNLSRILKIMERNFLIVKVKKEGFNYIKLGSHVSVLGKNSKPKQSDKLEQDKKLYSTNEENSDEILDTKVMKGINTNNLSLGFTH